MSRKIMQVVDMITGVPITNNPRTHPTKTVQEPTITLLSVTRLATTQEALLMLEGTSKMIIKRTILSYDEDRMPIKTLIMLEKKTTPSNGMKEQTKGAQEWPKECLVINDCKTPPSKI